MLQQAFNDLYDELRKYATQRAASYFRGCDGVLRDNAVEDAMEAVIEVWKDRPVVIDSYNREEAKKIIHDAIRQSSRKRTLQPAYLTNEEQQEYYGFHGYKEA